MEIPKDQILSMIQDQGGDPEQAAQQLPDMVDHEDHGDLLQQFGVDPQEAAQRAGIDLTGLSGGDDQG